MKKIKRLAIILAIVLAMSSLYSMTLLAAGDGKITLTPDSSIPSGTKYTLYQILELESFSGDNYSYKVAEKWSGFFVAPELGATYMTVNGNGYVEWTYATKTDADLQAFATVALAYAEKNNISGDTKEYNGTDAVEWETLSLGYYLVDSDAGLLCNLTTVDKEININGKNKVTIDKTAKNDANPSQNVKEVIQEIGDVVPFDISVEVYAGANEYIVHDDMTEGLTFNDSSVVIKNIDANNGVGYALVEGEDYNLKTSEICNATTNGDGFDGCDFHIVFTQTYLDSVSEALDNVPGSSQTVEISYTATVNEKAAIFGEGVNNNKAKLEYDNKHNTDWYEVIVNTYKFDLIKYDGKTKKFLTGAEFELYHSETGGTAIELIEDAGIYRIATNEEIGNDQVVKTTTIKMVSGTVTIKGLDAEETYYLQETKAPTGYNLLVNRVPVTFTNNGNLTYVQEEVAADTWNENGGGVAVENNTGSLLPSTGGMGTKLFITFGSVMALVAFVVLVARRRTDAYMS